MIWSSIKKDKAAVKSYPSKSKNHKVLVFSMLIQTVILFK